ncbi:hypothetical protein [Veillonella intestinalis]|uniref:hypothetical protein n=1 Tax=Veillonella intestinalis TaxID=2941341 RepID=UPI00203F5E74|nr:hypothetical protein [Veillonella intestinalis]
MESLSKKLLLALNDDIYNKGSCIKTLVIDFIGDFKRTYIEAAKRCGVQISDDSDRTVIRCLTFFRKLGGNNKKKIHYSEDFQAPDDMKEAIFNIIDKIAKGRSIIPFLSKQAIYIDKEPDLMFSEWGILHLHLGKSYEKDKRFIERSNELLFVKIEENDAYIIGVYKHDEQIWAKKQILQRVYDNWPNLFYQLNDLSVVEEFTDEERKTIRKKHGMVLSSLFNKNLDKNVVVMPNCIGLVSSGDPIESVNQFDFMCNKLKEIEKIVIKSTNGKYKIVNQVMHINHENTIKLSLVYIGGAWYIIDLYNHIVYERIGEL